MKTVKRIAIATIGVTGLILISKIVGFIREMVIAAYLGTSLAADVYQIASAIPLLVFESFVSAVALTFVPIIVF